MRLDYLTIFPGYLAPLSQSLTGKAAERGLIDVQIHDLRTWTHDRHHSVDDSPFGGGAGMVLRPEPFGRAFDELGVDGATIVVPTPAGARFTQAMARDLAGRERLVFLCGRYEGIDQRVLDHAADRAELVEVSLGDYVLNGGEVAALAITEAVLRLLPGFMGNAESLTLESHEHGLLEHPVYTRPASWRDMDVPAVLIGGDHGAIEVWREEQSRQRTVARRPDLLHASQLVHCQVADASRQWEIVPAVPADAPELLTLQLACWVAEAIANDDLDIPALRENLQDVRDALETWQVLVVRAAGRLIASVRARLEDERWQIGRLMVAPDLRGRGLGRLLLEHIEAIAPPIATSYGLFTGKGSQSNLRMYRKAGFRVVATLEGKSGPVVLVKPRRG